MEKALFIKIRQAKIFCRIVGNGDPLIFLHGNNESHTIFLRQLVYFQQYYRVILIDTRGHGHSTNEQNQSLSFELLADDLKQIIDILHLDMVSIVGFSDGANIALQFAVAHYERIQKLIIVGANMTPAGLTLKMYLSAQKDYQVQKFKGVFSNKQKQQANVTQLMVRHPHLTKSALQLIQTPTLVIAGEHDMIRLQHIKMLAGNMPQGLLQIIPNASHFLIQEYPDIFNELVHDFLQLTYTK